MDNLEKVLQAEVNTKVELNNHRHIRKVEFFYTISEKWYSWRAYTDNRSFYPSASSENIKTFKTLAGAKRNFIKGYLEND